MCATCCSLTRHQPFPCARIPRVNKQSPHMRCPCLEGRTSQEHNQNILGLMESGWSNQTELRVIQLRLRWEGRRATCSCRPPPWWQKMRCFSQARSRFVGVGIDYWTNAPLAAAWKGARKTLLLVVVAWSLGREWQQTGTYFAITTTDTEARDGRDVISDPSRRLAASNNQFRLLRISHVAVMDKIRSCWVSRCSAGIHHAKRTRSPHVLTQPSACVPVARWNSGDRQA
ncbi:hypothetical protein V8F06_003336 [Rhypophila decipiens]